MKKARSIISSLFLLLLGSPALAQGEDGGAPRSFWLGERASNDPLPVRIDELFNLIMWICIVATVVVFTLLIYYLVKYRAVPGRKAKFVHGNHKLEIIWTVIPAIILIWLAFTQVPTWNTAKVPSSFPKPEESTVVHIAAQQFDWNFRQPGLDGKFESYDLEKARKAFEEVKTAAEKPDATEEDKAALADFNTVSNKFFGKEDDDDIVSKTLTVPVNKPVLIELRSIDVIHSFFIPVMRIKQDAVPGKPMPVWFKPTKVNAIYDPAKSDAPVPLDPTKSLWEVMCAQLCGNNHTTMRAQIAVLSQGDYDKWLKAESAKKAGGIDRSEGADNVWMFWFKQGVRPAFLGELTKPWNELKLAKQEALKGHHAEHK